MATFNVSFLNPKLNLNKGGSGVGMLADQLAILENNLGKDGFLSPGDYDILIKKARDIQMGSSLTADQRSGYDVKISGYEKAKEVGIISRTSDIARMNKAVESEAAADVMVVGNNPEKFLSNRITSLQYKLNDLADTIQRKTAAGDDTIDYYNEYNATLQQYRGKMEAQQAMGGFANSDKKNPVQGYVAYVETNKNGEIVNVDYGKYGDKSGYAETNGMIDGFQVFGKVNYKQGGENYFKLGDKTFSAVDQLQPDPTNPGSFKTSPLMGNIQNPDGRFTRAKAGYINIDSSGLQIQSYLPADSWAKGANGSLYNRKADGTYVKYINAQEDKLNINGPVLNLPDMFEKSLMRNVTETVDASAPIAPDQGLNMSPATDLGSPIPAAPTKMNYGLDNPFNPSPAALPTSSMANPTPSAALPKSSKGPQAFRTPQAPSKAAASGFMAIANRTVQSGVQAIKNIFS